VCVRSLAELAHCCLVIILGRTPHGQRSARSPVPTGSSPGSMQVCSTVSFATEVFRACWCVTEQISGELVSYEEEAFALLPFNLSATSLRLHCLTCGCKTDLTRSNPPC
jgi:hypothetical protein